MKNIILFILFLLILGCNKGDETTINPNTLGQNISTIISPKQTDNNFPPIEESHYVVRNSKTHVNKLLLFIGGSYSVPKNYNLFCDHAATIGFDVISLSYPNNVATAPLGASTDLNIFDNYRQEICFGTPLSNVVAVDTFNSIVNRTVKLLQFLKINYPDQNWAQYLTTSGSLAWSKIAIAGPSQGSGHAGYLGKKNMTDRVIMLSGPNDYSTHFNSSAKWMSQSGFTPSGKYYALLHIKDEIVSYPFQVTNLKSLGILSSTQSPTLADNLAPPFGTLNAFSLDIASLSNHNASVGANPILNAVWTHMMTSN
jgi:hypothetical protein